MSNNIGIDWKKYKDDIATLYNNGKGSTIILKYLQEKYPEEKFNNGSDRVIRRIVAKLKVGNDSLIDETVHRNNLSSEDWKVAWVKEDGVSVLVRNPDFKNEVVDYDVVRDEMIEEFKKLSPEVRKYNRKKLKNPHCLVLDIADLHIGKLATEQGTDNYYNVDLAVERAIEGSESLIDKSFAYDIDKIFFVIGNDVLHIDTTKRTTTSGTPQDTDGMWYDNFKIARIVYCQIIQRLSTIADVHVIHCPSNHDYMSGFMLADAISCYFHNNKNITFDVSNIHRKYVQYGDNMLCFSHGDGAKIDQVPYLAAHESKFMWADTKYRYAYLHHIHHKDYWKFRSGKDFVGMTVEYLRSPSGTDRWHKDNGYTGAKVAIEAFIHHPTEGQICRLTHNF